MSRNSTRDASVHFGAADTAEHLLLSSSSDRDSAVPKKPWSIKGIDEATVQVCKLAARGKGMKINRWVSDALREAAQRQLGDIERVEMPQEVSKPSETSSALCERISRLEGEVSALLKSHAAFVAALVSK
jgi:hypothetical protein